MEELIVHSLKDRQKLESEGWVLVDSIPYLSSDGEMRVKYIFRKRLDTDRGGE